MKTFFIWENITIIRNINREGNVCMLIENELSTQRKRHKASMPFLTGCMRHLQRNNPNRTTWSTRRHNLNNVRYSNDTVLMVDKERNSEKKH